MSKKLPDTIEPRLWSITQTASYWGVSPNTFRKMYRDGIAPGPIDIPGGRLLFDRLAQEQAIDARSTVQSGLSNSPDPTWND